eukprot:2148153-Rhodomonas_salina.2
MACLPCLFHATAWSTTTDARPLESWMSTTSLKPSGSSSRALCTTDLSRGLMCTAAMAAAAAYRSTHGSTCASPPPIRSGTTTPII